MQTTEEKKPLEVKTTKGGYEYIEDDNGIKIRNSISPARLTEDNETFEEYKIRRRLSNQMCKNRKKTVWFSKKWGTLTQEKSLEIYNKMQELAKQKSEENGK